MSVGTLLDQFALLATAPEGVKRLRELILELAVRGKLVSQDPTDEPASELLKRIRAENAKKDRSAPEIGEDERPFELPGGWEWVRFGEIAQHNSGKTLDKARNSGVPRDYITTSNLYWGRFELESVRQMLIRDDELERCTARKGDLLICEGGEAGRAAVWEQDKEICFQNHIHRARLFGGIDPYYAYRIFERLNLTGEIDQYRKGVGISNMSSKSLASIQLPLPPLAEQPRIVAKVDELMSLCDRLETQQADAASAHSTLVKTLLDTLTQSQSAADFGANWQRIAQHFDTLFTTEASIDALKQTLLQLAVMGKLVAHDPNDEPASELLKRIQAEKAKLVGEGKIKKDKPLPEIGEDEKPFELPEGWEWVRFESVTTSRLGKMLDKSKNRGQLKPYLRNTNVQWGRFELDDIKELRLEEYELEELQILEGDLLICEGGEPGRCAIWRGEREEMYFQKALHRARPLCGVMPEYLQCCLRVDATSGLLAKYFTGATIKHFPGDKLARYVVSLPPVGEQQRIVAKVDELMALCDQLAARLKAARELAAQYANAATDAALEAA